uniref:Uncharacterized protein AlNc14C58G4348 n=1 Tax=Albugo laibachii Nc14 TaxID=890382 RepID=F0WCG8_9STRA|nr:conserved hypothetical protein [Albugo laibachii Nc14]|eukprot:CCA18883.1 conserved hypothetical protein [Albugo laibachii Nc14]
MTSIDYYRILKVARNATTSEIKQAYFKLAKELHPDSTRNDPTKAELFKRVTEAYASLSNASTRRQYDQQLGNPSYNWTHTNTNEDDKSEPLHGINEKVWLYHHYGPQAANGWSGMQNIVKEKFKQEVFERRKKQYKLDPMAGYFYRREARIEKYERETANQKKDEDAQGCRIS